MANQADAGKGKAIATQKLAEVNQVKAKVQQQQQQVQVRKAQRMANRPKPRVAASA